MLEKGARNTFVLLTLFTLSKLFCAAVRDFVIVVRFVLCANFPCVSQPQGPKHEIAFLLELMKSIPCCLLTAPPYKDLGAKGVQHGVQWVYTTLDGTELTGVQLKSNERKLTQMKLNELNMNLNELKWAKPRWSWWNVSQTLPPRAPPCSWPPSHAWDPSEAPCIGPPPARCAPTPHIYIYPLWVYVYMGSGYIYIDPLPIYTYTQIKIGVVSVCSTFFRLDLDPMSLFVLPEFAFRSDFLDSCQS